MVSDASPDPSPDRSESGIQQQLRMALLARAAERQLAAVVSVLVGLAVVGYAHWDGAGQALLPCLVALRLAALLASVVLARVIVQRYRRQQRIAQFEWGFVLASGAGGAAWGLVGWMVPDLNFSAWDPLDVFSAVALVFISSISLVTLASHGVALALALTSQWGVSCLHMLVAPWPMSQSTLIFMSILGMLAVLLLYGRVLHKQVREGVMAELRNSELTERLRRSNAELEHALSQAIEAASRDPLTGALNRRALYARADYLSAARRRTPWPGAVLLLDLDKFKRINDGYGHATGDLVLVAVATALRGELRELDAVARWGGEEFLVLMPDCEVGDALQRAEELRASVARLQVQGLPPTLRISVSIGVAAWPAGVALDAVIKAADTALYRAKDAGRNRVLLAS